MRTVVETIKAIFGAGRKRPQTLDICALSIKQRADLGLPPYGLGAGAGRPCEDYRIENLRGLARARFGRLR